MKSNQFHILGAELGETDSYIDVTVEEADADVQKNQEPQTMDKRQF